VIDRGEAMW